MWWIKTDNHRMSRRRRNATGMDPQGGKVASEATTSADGSLIDGYHLGGSGPERRDGQVSSNKPKNGTRGRAFKAHTHYNLITTEMKSSDDAAMEVDDLHTFRRFETCLLSLPKSRLHDHGPPLRLAPSLETQELGSQRAGTRANTPRMTSTVFATDLDLTFLSRSTSARAQRRAAEHYGSNELERP